MTAWTAGWTPGRARPAPSTTRASSCRPSARSTACGGCGSTWATARTRRRCRCGCPVTLLGGTGADGLTAGPLGDEVSGGEGNDSAAGGGGRRRAERRPGRRRPRRRAPGPIGSPPATARPTPCACGPGGDTVDADGSDLVAADCEGVTRTATAAPTRTGRRRQAAGGGRRRADAAADRPLSRRAGVRHHQRAGSAGRLRLPRGHRARRSRSSACPGSGSPSRAAAPSCATA